MAPQLTFGAILQEAREHKGMDVSSAARRLRIRPDILRAIEAEDFSRMPPRGYTRNMVHAYARLVGLNSSEITRMYLDAAYAFQVGKARSDTLPSIDAGMRRSSAARSRTHQMPSAHEERVPRQNALGRTLYDDRRNYTRGDYDGPAGGLRVRQSERTHPSRHSALPRSQYTNFYAGPQGNGSMQSRLPFVIAGVIILVLLIVIVFLVFGPKQSEDQTTDTTVPITGLDDTTQSGTDGQQQDQQAQQTLTAPTSVTVEYKISNSSDAYVEISVDGGAAEPAYLSAGTSETVEVTGTWSLATWTPDLVEVTLDGEVVEFSQTGTSIPTCTVDFEAYLEQWLEEHPGATAAPTSNASDGDTQDSAASGQGSGSQSSTTQGATGTSSGTGQNGSTAAGSSTSSGTGSTSSGSSSGTAAA